MIDYIFLAEPDDISRIIGIEYLESLNGWISVIKTEPQGGRARCYLVKQTIGSNRKITRSDPEKVIKGIDGEMACNLFMYICARLNQEEKIETTFQEERRQQTRLGDIVYYALIDKKIGQPLYVGEPPPQSDDITAVNSVTGKTA